MTVGKLLICLHSSHKQRQQFVSAAVNDKVHQHILGHFVP